MNRHDTAGRRPMVLVLVVAEFSWGAKIQDIVTWPTGVIFRCWTTAVFDVSADAFVHPDPLIPAPSEQLVRPLSHPPFPFYIPSPPPSSPSLPNPSLPSHPIARIYCKRNTGLSNPRRGGVCLHGLSNVYVPLSVVSSLPDSPSRPPSHLDVYQTLFLPTPHKTGWERSRQS